MSGAPIKKLPAGSSIGLPRISVANCSGEKINVGFSDFGAGGSNQLRDPGLRRSASNDRKFSLGNQFHMGPLLYHIKEVMFYTAERKRECFFVTLRIIRHIFFFRRRMSQGSVTASESRIQTFQG